MSGWRLGTTGGVMVNPGLVTGLTGSVGVTVTPEPGTLCVLGLGVVGLLGRRQKA